jgi:Leucine-rich repeat (LRR) protein
MPEGFVVEPGYAGPRVVVTGPWLPSIGRYMRKEGIDELYLNDGRGWKGDNIDFLIEFPDLTSFGILDLRIKDDSPVHHLRELRALELSTYSQVPIAFDRFEHLTDCTFYWRAGSESLFDATSLRSLFVHRYDGAGSMPFAQLRSLRSLSIANGALTEVVSLGHLRQAMFLGLYNLRQLGSLAGLGTLTQLHELEINGCKRIHDISELAGLVNLRRLQLNDDGPIESLGPIAGASQLEELLFYESTNVRDGDLSVLRGLAYLRNVSFQNRRHYSNRREEWSGNEER